jgi:hypothetical protein
LPRSRKLFDITVTQIHETAKAILLDDGKQQFWIPKSITGDDGILQLDPNADGTITLTAPEWWLLDRQLI